MFLYLLIIVLANVFIDVINILFVSMQSAWYLIVLYTLICTITCFLIDLIIAFLIRALPEKLFNPNKKIFKIFAWERKFYEFIGVKHFKDKVPEVGRGFRKNKVSDPKNPEYIYRFMLECCYGEVIHLISVPIAFVAMFAVPLKHFLYISLPVIIVNAVLSLLPFCVLRYNRKKLEAIYIKLQNKL